MTGRRGKNFLAVAQHMKGLEWGGMWRGDGSEGYLGGKWTRFCDSLAMGSSRKMSRVISGLTAKGWGHSRNHEILEQETFVLFVCFFWGLKNGRCFNRLIGGAIVMSDRS